MIEAEAPGSAPGNKPLPFADQRAAAALSIADAAREFGVPLATIADWDHGIATPPGHVLRSLEMIGRFCAESQEIAAFQAPQPLTVHMPIPKAIPSPMSASSDLIKSKQRVHLDIQATLVSLLIDALPRLKSADFHIFQSHNPNSRFDRFCSDGGHFPGRNGPQGHQFSRAILGPVCGPYGPGIDWNPVGHFRTEPSKSGRNLPNLSMCWDALRQGNGARRTLPSAPK